MKTTIRPILLVEDNPMDVELTQRAFGRMRDTHPLVVARDGDEALAWLPRWESGEPRPLLMLLDINMPRINGLELLKSLRANPVSSMLPIVVLTTSAVSADIRAAYECGANSYIVKPVDFDRFCEIAASIVQYWSHINCPPE